MTGVKRIAQVNQKECVACGCCLKVCKFEAIQVKCGVYAIVDEEKCKGCSMCQRECPAWAIQMKQREMGI